MSPLLRRTALLLLALVLAAAPARAQIDLAFTPRDDLNATLPPTIEVYEAVDTSLPLRAWYVRATPPDTAWVLQALRSDEGDGVETVSSFVEGAEAFVGINAGYFGSGQSFSLVVQDGQVLSTNIGALNRSGTTFFPTRSAFGRLEDGTLDVAWIYDVAGTTYAYPAASPNAQGTPQPQPSAAFPEGGAPWPVEVGVGGGPVLVEEGQPMITWEEEVFFGSGIGEPTTRNPRTAIGYTEAGDVLLVVVEGRSARSRGVSLVELAELMIDLGAVEALNMDGGGSSTLVVGDEVLLPSGFQREVASALVLAPPTDGGGGEVGDETIVDTGDASYREVGEWFESANTPYHGTTPARLHATGDGEATATFVFPELPAGTYDLSAWWVPSGNRSSTTPYVIYEQGTPTTVRVDQSAPTTLGTWNPLGRFDLAPGDSVVITNDAVGSFVVADAVRALRVTTTARGARAVPEAAALALYPQPARDHLMVRAAAVAGPATLRIVDLLGRTVTERTVPAGGLRHGLRLDVAALAAGVYAVQVVTPAAVQTRVFIRAR